MATPLKTSVKVRHIHIAISGLGLNNNTVSPVSMHELIHQLFGKCCNKHLYLASSLCKYSFFYSQLKALSVKCLYSTSIPPPGGDSKQRVAKQFST